MNAKFAPFGAGTHNYFRMGTHIYFRVCRFFSKILHKRAGVFLTCVGEYGGNWGTLEQQCTIVPSWLKTANLFIPAFSGIPSMTRVVLRFRQRGVLPMKRPIRFWPR